MRRSLLFLLFSVLMAISCKTDTRKPTAKPDMKAVAKRKMITGDAVFGQKKDKYWTELKDKIELTDAQITQIKAIDGKYTTEMKKSIADARTKDERKNKIKAVNQAKRDEMVNIIGEDALKIKNAYDRQWRKEVILNRKK